MSDIVTTGLAQINDAGLKRLMKHIDAGKPLCLSGHIFDPKSKAG